MDIDNWTGFIASADMTVWHYGLLHSVQRDNGSTYTVQYNMLLTLTALN